LDLGWPAQPAWLSCTAWNFWAARIFPGSLPARVLIYSFVSGWLTVRHMKRAEHPLINFDTLQAHTFSVALWGGTLFRVSIMASPFLLPLMFQVAFGLPAFQSGLLVLSMFAAI